MLKLELKQHQSLTLTPQMKQAIAILQMSCEVLDTYLMELSMENPLLDYTPVSGTSYSLSSGGVPKGYGVSPFDFVDCSQDTLKQFLLLQTATLHLDRPLEQTVLYLIESLDDNGYFCEPVEELPVFLPSDLFLKGLGILQKMEPKGVGARNLTECLLLQLDPSDALDRLCIRIIQDHFPSMGRNQLPRIARALQVPLKDIQRAQKRIGMLNPRPSQGFSGNDPISQNGYIVPDIEIQNKDGRYCAVLNKQSQPIYQINSYYQALLKSSGKGSEELKAYLSEKYRQANWIIKCIVQRNQTLSTVSQALVAWQQEFFEKGPQYLKPMRLQDLAVPLGMSISTVSRALKDKYLSCKHGVYKMQYFLDSSVSSQELTSAQSRQSLKHQIQELILQENKHRPYSDQQIANILTRKGSPIARRTVAKYREQLDIGPASTRRQYEL